MAEVEADAAEVFGYRKDERPQDRAHAYIERRRVARGFSDTALQVAAVDMCRRSYELGRAEALADAPAEAQRAAAALTEVSGRLLATALELRGLSAARG
jgi:hypothetical protein